MGPAVQRPGVPALKRVVHIITGLEQGGAEGVLRRLALSQAGRLRVAVVSLTTEGVHGQALRAAGVEVIALGLPRGRVRIGPLLRLWRYLRSTRPDIVQTWMYHADLLGGLVARLAGCRSVLWCLRNSSLDPRSTARSTRWVMRLCARLSRHLPAAIVSCSQAASDLHAGFGYARKKFVLIPNGFDLRRFAPSEQSRSAVRQALGLGPAETVFGCVARWDPQKDHRSLLAALARAMDAGRMFKLLLVGSGMTTANAALTALIRDLGLQQCVLLLGPRADVEALMCALDWHLLASAYGEAFPNAVAESMACGVPNIVTDVGDAAMIVGDCGMVLPPGNVDALAAAIERACASSADEHAALSHCGRQRIESAFALEAMVAGYERVWAQQLSKVKAR